jgi:hypothetical protein
MVIEHLLVFSTLCRWLSIILTHLANVRVCEGAGVVIVEALTPGAGVERDLHAVLDAVCVVGLSRQPVDGRVREPRARGAPTELEWTPLVAAGRPEYFVVELRFSYTRKPQNIYIQFFMFSICLSWLFLVSICHLCWMELCGWTHHC